MAKVIQFPSRGQTAEMEYELILSEVEDRINIIVMNWIKQVNYTTYFFQNKDDDVL
ncbi:MAG: hypothetical protein CM15mV11_2770 [Caudoviricetes sp.]|nr:MAG: hypothetical protein CM15mV11_2770 [Caudoviricetes sp.]